MKKFFYLSSCTTCKRIIKDLNLPTDFNLQDIKTQNISADELDKIHSVVGSYEDIFSKRAQKFRGLNLHTKVLKEDDYRKLILEEYTFLKRPVMMCGNNIITGNSKAAVLAMQGALNS